jgi:hypothetical protein
MNAIKFPLRIFPLKESVCSKDEVTKEMNEEPSAFIANKIIPIKSVNAPIPR